MLATVITFMVVKIMRFLDPLFRKMHLLQTRATEGALSARDAFIRGILIAISAILLIFFSIFLYTVFYYAYMPSMLYTRPVHLGFNTCENIGKACNYPSATVELTDKRELLMVGQQYKINLNLEMPESQSNKDLGMFMVCMDLTGRDGKHVGTSCRAAMLHYRSPLLNYLTTLVFSPFMIFGDKEEKQNLNLELFGNFQDDQNNPVTKVNIEIKAREIEYYSAQIIINAHLSGLRYLMFHWPILSSIVGISTNLFFIATIVISSYLHFTVEEETESVNFMFDAKNKQRKNKSTSKKDTLLDSFDDEMINLKDPERVCKKESKNEAEKEANLVPEIEEISSWLLPSNDQTTTVM